MDTVYIIRVNDALLTDEAYRYFDDAAKICESMTGVLPLEEGRMYQTEDMQYVKIVGLTLA